MPKIIIPCIRGLKRFEKPGCPEKWFDRATGEGCPAWKEYTIPGEDGKPPTILKGCIDTLSEYWQFEAIKMMEGNQIATESLRNGLCEEVNGETRPKPDAATMALFGVLSNGNLASIAE